MHIKCEGGTKDGQRFEYPHPLPDAILFQRVTEGITEVYERKPQSQTFVHANDIPIRKPS